MSAAPPDAGGRRRPPPMTLALPQGLVVVGDEAVRRAVVARLGVNFRATVCSDINAAVEMLRERMKEFDFMVVSDKLIRCTRPEIMKFLREETERRLLVLRNEGGNEYSFKAMPNSRTEEEGQLEPVRPSTTNREISHASSSRLPAASPYGDSNSSTATMVVAPAAIAASSVKRATNNRRKRRRAEEQSGLYRQKKRRLVWTNELQGKFVEAYNQLLLTENSVPTTILKLMKSMIDPMNDPELTRDNIASYLQKHKIRLKKEDQNRLKQEEQNRQNLLKQKDQQLPIDENTNTSSIQQQIMHSMNNQQPILSESRYNEHSNKQPKLLTANYHKPRNMHHHHRSIINIQPSNVVQPPNLTSAKEFNMPFNKAGVDEGIYQSKLMAHRVSANHVVAAAQASWRVTMT